MALGYREYMGQAEANKEYIAYQARYTGEPRESDRKLGEILQIVAPTDGRILDAGCSTGNLVRYLRHLLPDATVEGCDLMAEALPDEAGFFVCDALQLPEASYDVVVMNAVIYQLTDDETQLAFWSAAKALTPGGHLIVFDLLHYRNQTLRIVEESSYFPQGLPLTIRPYATVERFANKADLVRAGWWPFRLYKPLPIPAHEDDLTTWTDGMGLSFRGCLNQPWCHAVFRKPA